MSRLLERLDAAASTVVPLAYLAGLLLGTMSYFAGLTLDAGLAVGIALALAAELHSFLEQRRVRALWAAYQRQSRTRDEDASRERLAGQLRAHAAILAALVTFSAINATAFAAETWHPAPGFLPAWLQIGIRGAVVPLLFLLTGALSPLSTSASDELAGASRSMLRKTVRSTVRQWNARIDRARRSGVDLAPVAVSLMLDAGDADGARRVALIAEGLAAAESGTPAAAPAGAIIPAATGRAPVNRPTTRLAGAGASLAAETPKDTAVPPAALQRDVQAHGKPSQKPPTGTGSPAAAKRRRVQTPRGRTAPAVLRLTPEGGYDAERRIRAVLAETPAASVKQIAERAQVSSATASKYRRLVLSERGVRQANARPARQLAQ